MPDTIRFMDGARCIAQERSERERDLTQAAREGTGHPALAQAYRLAQEFKEPEAFKESLRNAISIDNFYATRGPMRTLADITEDGTYGHVKDLERWDGK